MRSLKALEVALSKLKTFEKAKVRAEQYSTPSSIAAEVLWKAYHNGDIEGKTIADLGCGTGILGIGCLLLGAKKVIFVEKDGEALALCKVNVESESLMHGAELREADIDSFDEKIDVIIMNPPFGTKQKHADTLFLLRAFSCANVTYSFHKTSTLDYLKKLGKRNGKEILEMFHFSFPLVKTMAHHEKKRKFIDVSCCLWK